MIKQYLHISYIYIYVVHQRYFISIRFDIRVQLSWQEKAESRACRDLEKLSILSILITITFYSVYEYNVARLNVTNGTVNLAGELIKNLECETRECVSRGGSLVVHLQRVIPQIVIEFLRVPPFESFVK